MSGKRALTRLNQWRSDRIAFRLAQQEQYERDLQERMRQTEIEQHRKQEAARESDRQRNAQMRKELESSLPGIWLTIYDALKTAGHGLLARQTIGGMICTDSDKKINVKDNPLPPEGARHILSLAGGEDRDALSCWIDDYVAEWIRNEAKSIPMSQYSALANCFLPGSHLAQENQLPEPQWDKPQWDEYVNRNEYVNRDKDKYFV